MLRVLSVGLLAWCFAGVALAGGLLAPDAGRGPTFSEKKIDRPCGDGLAADTCKTTCPACSACAAGAMAQVSSPAIRDLPLVPASQLVDDVRAPDTAPPKHLPA